MAPNMHGRDILVGHEMESKTPGAIQIIIVQSELEATSQLRQQILAT